MPLLSRRFGRKSRRTRSSPPERDWASLHTPRPTASTPFDHTPPRTPSSPSISEQLQSTSTRTSTSSQVDEQLWRLLNNDHVTNLTSPEEAFNPDMPSPNDMMVDTEEHIVEPTANDAEKDSLTIINPDNLETETEQLQDLPRADDCTCKLEGAGKPSERRADATQTML